MNEQRTTFVSPEEDEAQRAEAIAGAIWVSSVVILFLLFHLIRYLIQHVF